ncbi:hypothetical protein [Streptomyces sp. NPDC001985]|uniref:hypothetical protein n=1 Tax=Streptomyces sp. NPDC001985 TaxID=3154406 RepID=UPI00331D3BE9
MSKEAPPDEAPAAPVPGPAPAAGTDGGEAPRPDPPPPDRTPGPPPDPDGPVGESDALASLARGGDDDRSERSEALRAGVIADLIAERLNADTAGTRIGTLALFNDTVSFGGGFSAGGGARAAGAGGPAGTASVALHPSELADHTEWFIQPEEYDTALEALRADRLVVLTAAPGTGREAAAVNLLAEALAMSGTGGDGADGAGGCHRLLDPRPVLGAGWEPPVRECGLLAVVDGAATGVRAVDAAAVRGLHAALRASGCYLVLIGGHDLELALTGLAPGLPARFRLSAVDPLTVVERRVLGHGADRESRDELRALLERGGAVAALRERPSAGHAVRLASVVRAGGDLAAAVAALRDPSEQVREWFHRHRDPDALAFALAAAVLEDSGYLTVAEAAIRLRTALSEPVTAPPDVRFRDRLADEQSWLRLEPAPEGGPPRVRFRSALLRQVVLACAWTTLDGRRDALLEWLRRLLTHPDLEVRARAAVAAGVLAWADHHYAVHRFLTSWAGSTSWPVRQAAATALGVAGSRADTEDPVWELLRTWASSGTSAHARRLAGTAANAVGGLLGRNSPGRAVQVLRAALDRDDDWGTLAPVAWGGVHLIHQGRAREVLDAYLDWSEPQDLSPPVVKTLSAFVFAVSLPYEEGTAGSARGAVPGVPLLLARLRENPERLAELWARALARRPTQEPALDALREWLDVYGPRCPGGPARLAELVAAIARRPGKHRQRLRYWLDRWARDRDRPSEAAARLLSAVERG